MDTEHKPSNSSGIYLAHTSIDERRTRLDFVGIKDKLAQKLSGWKAYVLLNSCMVILIKSNLMDISQYSMTWFKIPSECVNRSIILTGISFGIKQGVGKEFVHLLQLYVG